MTVTKQAFSTDCTEGSSTAAQQFIGQLVGSRIFRGIRLPANVTLFLQHSVWLLRAFCLQQNKTDPGTSAHTSTWPLTFVLHTPSSSSTSSTNTFLFSHACESCPDSHRKMMPLAQPDQFLYLRFVFGHFYMHSNTELLLTATTYSLIMM